MTEAADSTTSLAGSSVVASDALAQGLVGLLQPVIEELDTNTENVRASQTALHTQIDCLLQEMQTFLDEQQREQQELGPGGDLEIHVRRLASCKRRIATVNNTLRDAQDRLERLSAQVAREHRRRKEHQMQHDHQQLLAQHHRAQQPHKAGVPQQQQQQQKQKQPQQSQQSQQTQSPRPQQQEQQEEQPHEEEKTPTPATEANEKETTE